METTIYQPSDHILLTSLGTQARKTEYELDGQPAEAELTPLALVQLLKPEQLPNSVVAVITQEAKNTTWKTFQAGIFQILGFDPERVDIPNGSSREEIGQILESVAERIPEGAELTLDVTQGLRHFPFIFYALVLYLKSLRGVKIRGAYYGMIEGSPPNTPKPIIDLQPLLELPEWFHAVRMFRDQGTTKPMADLLQPLADVLMQKKSKLFKSGNQKAGTQRNEQAKQAKSSVDWLKKYAFAYESALPLELEKASKALITPIQQLPTINFAGLPPLIAELVEAIVSAAEKSAFATPPSGGKNWKRKIPLDENELKRQAYMIDLYLGRDQLSLAVGLMREWVISWAIWNSGQSYEKTGAWLTYKLRQSYEHRLGAIGAFVRDPAFRSTITDEQKEFGTFWNQLTNELRNALHHHAMREDLLEEPPNSLEDVRGFWNELKKGRIDLPPLGGNGGRLLLSPQGTKPGVLFSALKVARPDTCLVICSATSAGSITEAAKRADFEGPIKQIELTDPFGGFDEIDAAAEHAHRYLLNSDKVVANMTGGTTLMGLIVQRLSEDAQKLDRPIKRFALVDRRPIEEQDSDPFVESDCHWLDRS